MRTQSFEFQVNIPSVEDFAIRFRQYGNFARNEGQFLFDLLMTPTCFNSGRVATIDFDLPAVAGVAKLCFRTVEEQNTVEWNGFLKQFIGAVVCTLMEANGFEKTGTKKAIPHKGFTKGEFYRPINNSNL